MSTALVSVHGAPDARVAIFRDPDPLCDPLPSLQDAECFANVLLGLPIQTLFVPVGVPLVIRIRRTGQRPYERRLTLQPGDVFNIHHQPADAALNALEAEAQAEKDGLR